ncbi:MAG: phosphotransferase family protein, partial [Altererythrobacter sp.]|nr:phosphotransferase family protein [Altererythrobacter sp.]
MADSFEEKLTAVLAHAIAGFETLVSCDRLSGGASQETYRIEIASRGSTRLLAMRRATGGEDD